MSFPYFEILCMAIRQGEKLRMPREGISTSVLVIIDSQALGTKIHVPLHLVMRPF